MEFKNIKFSRAIETMNPGDVFSPYSSDYCEFIMNENGSFKGTECDNPKELALTKRHLMLVGDVIPVKPEEIFVWGVSHEQGVISFDNYIGINPAEKGLNGPNLEYSETDPVALFPIDKPQKYKLVAVED